MPSLHDFETWEPLLRFLREGNEKALAGPGGFLAGRIDRYGGWGQSLPPGVNGLGRGDWEREADITDRVRSALGDRDDVLYAAEIRPSGRAVLYLFDRSPAVESGGTQYPGSLVLVEQAVPEPWRRLPDPNPAAVPAPSADPELLERTLRERLPDTIGATQEDIAAVEARLNVALPDELKALYRVIGEDYERSEYAIGWALFPLSGVHLADVASRPCQWEFGAMEAVFTPPDAAVQGVVGSPGWITFGDSGGGDALAVDLTPGPDGHLGQIIMLSHEEYIGADLIAESLTDLVLNRRQDVARGRSRDESPAIARVNEQSLPSVSPELEVLTIGWRKEPLSLAPFIGLPRLRSLHAIPGKLADPLEIARLTGLEFLELGPDDWRVLLDAKAVPRSLSAATIHVDGAPHPVPIVDIANELLALWDRPLIGRTVLEGDLGPA